MAIRVTPEELRALAKDFDTSASDIVSFAQTLSNKFSAGTANFEGNTAARFAQAFNDLIPSMNTKLPQLFADMASELRKTADNFEALDG